MKNSRKTGFKKPDTSWDVEGKRLNMAITVCIICLAILGYAFFTGEGDLTLIEIFRAGFYTSLGFILRDKISGG